MINDNLYNDLSAITEAWETDLDNQIGWYGKTDTELSESEIEDEVAKAKKLFPILLDIARDGDDLAIFEIVQEFIDCFYDSQDEPQVSDHTPQS